MLVGAARVAYSDAKNGIDETRAVTVVTPIGDGAIAVNWEQAEPADFTVDDLAKSRPAEATFAAVPPAAAKAKSYAGWQKDFATWVAQSQSIELLKSPGSKAISNPDETERDFRIRIQADAREQRDAAIAKVRDKYAARRTTLDDRIRRAEQTVQVQNEQATGAKLGAAVSVGAAIFGALLGRKTISAANIGRATTAARGMSKISKESEDVTRASQNVDALKAQLADLDASMQADIQSVTADFDLAKEEFQRVLLKPKRGGVSVQLVGLVWVPIDGPSAQRGRRDAE